MRAVQIEEFGGPEVLRLAELPVPEPGPGEVLIRVARAGLNFGDTHQRRNQYIAKHELPVVLGGEVAGVIERLGPPAGDAAGSDAAGSASAASASAASASAGGALAGGSMSDRASSGGEIAHRAPGGGDGAAHELAEGDRVVALLRTGGYAEYAVAPAARAFRIPDGVSDDDALALLIQGLTAWHLLRTSAHLAEGESVVVHSAAGGVGSLLTQLARPMGAGRVIATAGSPERRAEALELGADVAVAPDTGPADAGGPPSAPGTPSPTTSAGSAGTTANAGADATAAGTAERDSAAAAGVRLAGRDGLAGPLTDALIAANEGRPVDVVLDAAGGAVFAQSLAALGPFGRIVAYGNSTREKVAVTNGDLLRSSRSVVGFWLMHLLDRRELLAAPLADLFARAARGELRPRLGGTYPLAEAARAHADLEARRTTGKLTLDTTA